jgi:hypothetical protein
LDTGDFGVIGQLPLRDWPQAARRDRTGAAGRESPALFNESSGPSAPQKLRF